MFPVDAVFLWVDGNDPAHRSKRMHWRAREGIVPDDANTEQRFADHGELRYALRSLELHAPWIRRVHIVTDGQIPYWLNTAHSKISLVRHDMIFPCADMLPTFNSRVIEAFVDRIPGLAEQFLLFNDDCVLAKPMVPSHFFTEDGRMRIFPSGEWIPEYCHPENPTWMHALVNANALLDTRFGSACRRRLLHQARPLLRSVCTECREQNSSVVDRMTRRKFRSPDDITFAWCLASYFAFHTNRAVSSHIANKMILVLDDPNATKSALRSALSSQAALLCINDTTTTPAQSSWECVLNALEIQFPNRSTFECSPYEGANLGERARASGSYTT